MAARARPPLRSAWAVMRSVVFALYLRELKTRLDGRWWGALWVVGEPLANLVFMLLIYSLLRTRQAGGVDILLFLVTGLLPFQLLKSLVLRGMESIDANQGLFGYRQVRPIDAVISRICVETSLGVVLLLLTVFGLAWAGHDVLPVHPLSLLFHSGLLVGLGFFLGLLTAVATGGVMARFRVLVRLIFFPLYLASGVVFPLSSLPLETQQVLLWNPLVHLFEGLRAAFFGEGYRAIDDVTPAVPMLWLVVIAVLSLSLYRVRREQLMSS